MTKRLGLALLGVIVVVGALGVSIQAGPPDGAGFLGPLTAAVEQVLGIVTGTATDVQDIKGRLDDPESGLQEIKAEVRAIEEMVVATPRIVTVKSTFSTSPDAVTLKNLDVVAGLPFGVIKRYSLLVNPGQLVTADPGTATLEVMTSAADGSAPVTHGTRAFIQDISSMSPQPNPGGVFPTFAGTGTFLRVTRSGDGMGNVDVTVNAYIEMAQ